MRHGDWIKFVIAVDRRDKLRRATKIELLDESFQVSDERREQGTVHSLRYVMTVYFDSKIFRAFSIFNSVSSIFILFDLAGKDLDS